MKYRAITSFSFRTLGRALPALTAGLLMAGMTTAAHAQAPAGMHLVWSDEFTGANVSASPYSGFWKYDTGGGGWGNNEWEIYVNSWANAHVVWDGTGTDSQALRIQVEKDGAGNYYSARINTSGKVSNGPYGYYETRCKFPNSGAGLWPAVWLLGNNIGSVGWPKCGEIDIAEEINGQWENHQSLHAPYWDPTVVRTVNSSTTTYHNYGVMWQPEYITFYTDGQATATWTNGHNASWVFNGPVFWIINCAVGGNWPGPPNGGTVIPAQFFVDYVRVYQY